MDEPHQIRDGPEPEPNRQEAPPAQAGPARLGDALRAAFGTLTSPSEEELTWTCERCNTLVRPLEIEVLGRKRLVRGNCPNCRPAWLDLEERREAERQERQRESRLASYAAAFPAAELGRLQECTLENFEERPGTETALRRAREFAAGLPLPQPEGLMLWGRPGNGKSHLGAGIARAARERGMAVAWVHVPTWLRQLGAMDTDRREHLLSMAAQADLLVLDELGAGRMTASRLDWLLYAVEERYRHRRALVVTSNYDLDRLAQLLSLALRSEFPDADSTDGERLADRILEMCRQVEVRAPSFRPQLARKRMTGGG